jgi:hypothetical protein
VLKLLELQRHALLMYTSCGWFFDEISGIESVQVIQYAARAIQLAGELFEQDLEPEFLNRLERARSNLPEHSDGRAIYAKFVKPAMIDLPKVTAHYAISSIFNKHPEKIRVFSYTFEDEDRQVFISGKSRLGIGRVRVISEITLDSAVLSYAMLYLGEHNVTGGVRCFGSNEAYDIMAREIRETFEHADFPETIRLIDRHFESTPYSLKSLFKDEQRRILEEILATTREDLEGRFRLIAERYEPLMRFLQDVHTPLPPALKMVSNYVLHDDLIRQFQADQIELDRLRSLLEQAVAREAVLDPDVSYWVKHWLEERMRELAGNPADVERIAAIEAVAALVLPLPLGLNLWKVQNTYWELLQNVVPSFRTRADGGNAEARLWLERFLKLGQCLRFSTDPQLNQAAPAAHEQAA